MGEIDIRCAVNYRTLMRYTGHRLPIRGTVLAYAEELRDVCGRKRSPATLPGFRKGVIAVIAARPAPGAIA